MSKVLVTPEAILSYPSVFKPRAMNEGDTPKYEATFIFTEGTDLSELQQAVVAVGKAKWGDKFPEMVKKGQVKLPFRTDWEAKGYPEDSTFFAARSHNKPGVVSIYPDPNSDPENPRPALITDESQIYAGAIVKGLVSCYAYTKPNKGITFGLEGLQKVRDVPDEERLDGRVNPQSVFEVDEEAFASLESSLDEMEEAQGDDDAGSDESDDIMALLGG